MSQPPRIKNIRMEIDAENLDASPEELATLCKEIKTIIRIRHPQTTFCTLIFRSIEWSDGKRKPE